MPGRERFELMLWSPGEGTSYREAEGTGSRAKDVLGIDCNSVNALTKVRGGHLPLDVGHFQVNHAVSCKKMGNIVGVPPSTPRATP